jgi:hypothetical protein
VETLNVPEAIKALKRAEQVKLERRVSHDESLHELLQSAREVVDKYSGVYQALASALQGKQRQPKKLQDAAAQASDVGETTILFSMARECERLVSESKQVAVLIAKQLDRMPSRDKLNEFANAEVCELYGLGGMPEMSLVRDMLSLSEDKYLHEQIRVAAKAGDDARRIDLLIQLRVLHMSAANHKQFRPEQFDDLRPANEWSNGRRRFIFGRPRFGYEMMAWSPNPLVNRPLTKTARDVEAVGKLSYRASASLMRFMGDLIDHHDAVDELCSMLEEAFRLPAGRDEVYCILMKQLNKNAGVASCKLGWLAMDIMLDSFSPSPALDLIVEVFIRTRAPKPPSHLIDKLHKGIFTKQAQGPPSRQDVAKLLLKGGESV